MMVFPAYIMSDPITVPRFAGQLPMYYNHKPSAQFHDYLSEPVTPL